MSARVYPLGAILAVSFALSTGLAFAAANESWLLLEQADRAEFRDGRITLTGMDDSVIMFSERPFRNTKRLPLTQLIENWGRGSDSFITNPPNAALTGLRDGKQMAVVLELSDPAFSEGELSFSYVPIEGEEVSALSHVTLLIDNPCWMPGACS
ncbi:MAG: hypothetical protein AAF699_14285 [Pseudomonadota bacterium]